MTTGGMPPKISVRFRHPQGDVGPFDADPSWTGAQCRSRLVAEWPRDGPLAAQRSTNEGQVRLIMNGGEMKPEATLALMWPGGAQEMEDGMVLTLHVQLRPQEAKASAAKPKEEPKKGELASGERSQGCACVIM